MNVAFQFLDVVVVLVLLASTVYALYRGFVSESLSVFAWVAAAFAMLYFGPWASYWVRDMVEPRWLGEAIGYVVVFLVVLLPLAFASARISENVKRSQVGTLDSAFGAGFGLLRGFVIIGVAYLLFMMAVPGSQPGWLVNARLYPVVKVSAEVVASLIPDQAVSGKERAPEKIVEKPVEKPVMVHETAKKKPATAAKPKPAKHVKKAYGAKDRHALDRLIETTDSDTSGKP